MAISWMAYRMLPIRLAGCTLSHRPGQFRGNGFGVRTTRFGSVHTYLVPDAIMISHRVGHGELLPTSPLLLFSAPASPAYHP
jgi:hypothetical protein